MIGVMNDYDYFELHRLSDGLVYQFDKLKLPNGNFGYKRRDQDLWIKHDDTLGWIASNEETKELQGRSWETLPELQKEYPPEGIWVSKKGIKSYVYELKYMPKKKI